MPTSDLRLNGSLDNANGLSVDDSGYVKIMKTYGSQGFSVSCVHPTTTIVGSEGSIILENTGRGKYAISVVDANDTARVPVSKNYREGRIDLDDANHVHEMLRHSLGIDNYVDLFGDEPREDSYDSLDDQYDVPEGEPFASFWARCSRMDGVIPDKTSNGETKLCEFSYFKGEYSLGFDFNADDKEARAGKNYIRGGIIVFKNEDENGRDGFWGAFYDGSRILPLTKRLVVEDRNPGVFGLVRKYGKQSESEIETRFGSWINKNPELHERAKHVIRCLEGPEPGEDISFIEDIDRFKDGDGGIDFGAGLYFDEFKAVLLSTVGMFGYKLKGQHRGSGPPFFEYKSTDMGIIIEDKQKPSAVFSANRDDVRSGSFIGFYPDEIPEETMKRFVYTVRKECERILPDKYKKSDENCSFSEKIKRL